MPLLASVERHLREVLGALAAWSAQAAENEPAGGDHALFGTLYGQLRGEGGSAMATAMRLAPVAERLGCGASFAEVMRLVETFDYEAAAKRLEALAGQEGIGL